MSWASPEAIIGHSECELYHTCPNPDNQGPTIAFIPGLGASNLEFAQVLPHLQNYHLLLVDLPGHAGSRHIPGPYTYQAAAEHVSRSIQRYAHGGRAHVVGFSMGGFVGLHLTAVHPDRVLSLFASGAAPFVGGRRWAVGHPWLVYSMESLVKRIPDGLYSKFRDWFGLPPRLETDDDTANAMKYGMFKEAFTSLLDFDENAVASVARSG